MTINQNIELDSKSMKDLQHQNEIQRTRIGGFGGSDAKMFYKIGLKGLSALSNSDKKRIRVAKGIDDYKPIFQTEAMRKGHEFEDWYYSIIDDVEKITIEREFKLDDNKLSKNFDIFAHADLYRPYTKFVYELKFLSNTSDIDKYEAQGQWYFMLGAQAVYFVVGDSTEVVLEEGAVYNRPFIETVRLERDEQFIKTLLHGVKLLDDNWDNLNIKLPEEWTSEDLLPFEATEVELMTNYLQEIKRLESMIEQKKVNLLQFMQDNGVKSINSENYIIANVPAGTTSRFDKAKLLKDFPEIDESKYTTTSERKGYITIKLK